MIDIKNTQAWYWKSKIYIAQEKYKEAIECCDKALNIEPNYADAWYNKGYILYKQEKYKEAITHTANSIIAILSTFQILILPANT